jgi:phosphate-selective porin OprO/OprP
LQRLAFVILALLACEWTVDHNRLFAQEDDETSSVQEPVLFEDNVDTSTPVTDSLDDRLNALEQEIEMLKARPVAAPPKPVDPIGMTGKWNNGMELNSNNKAFKIHVGGRAQLDSVFYQNSSSFNNTGGAKDQDSVNFRRGRLRVDGTMYEIFDFAAEYDFVNEFNINPGEIASETNHATVTAVTDLWINIKQVPWIGNLKIGSFKDPIGMEHLTSSRFLEFMERSPIQDTFTGAFNNGFLPGIQAWDTYDEEHGTWATGFFKNTTNIFDNGYGDGEYVWTSRLTYLPIYEDDGDVLLHLGVAGSMRDPNNDVLRYRSRPSLRNGAPSGINPIFIDTLTFGCSHQDLLGLELAGNYGPFNFQSELMNSWTNNTTVPYGPFAGTNLGTAYVNSFYVEGLYFLTGETRPYERKQGVFTRVIPNENFKWGKGLGAWQVGARYTRTDLKTTSIDGGILQDVTLGLNWFLNPNMKFQFNYVLAKGTPPTVGPARGLNGVANGFGTRLAIDF